VLTVSTPSRYRNKEHLRFVAQQPCLLCTRKPSDPHHLRFVQPRALGRKASDEFAAGSTAAITAEELDSRSRSCRDWRAA
jgi:hypothetical protein